MNARIAFGLAAVFLLLGLMLPLWFTHMEAPQYKGDEALNVRVYADHVEGDLDEIRLLNRYVGVVLPKDFSELDVAPWVIGALLLLAAAGAAVPGNLRRWVGAVLLVGFVVCAFAGTQLLHQRLHALGHERTPSAFARIDDFMPPLIGTAKIANFTVHTGIGPGGWALGSAFGLSVCGVFMAFRRREHR
ncbi:MAG: hypothetical protein R3C68_04715 [Myxococcota bacterium]